MLRAGVVGMLAGNAFAAATAGQIFSDPFVYVMIGILLGIGLGPLAAASGGAGVSSGMNETGPVGPSSGPRMSPASA